jgi:ParB family transcriptional regulator, chromosome partitioning protein
MSQEKPRRLGRGLEALLGGAAAQSEASASAEGFREIPIGSIRPNRYQPRKTFREEEIAELKASLAENGLLQPLTVRADADGFELIAGERRLRAATSLGWTHIPAIIKKIDDKAALTLALVENLQRTDLNAMEEAQGYLRLQEEFSLTQQQIAQVVGKERSTVANMLRLLALPESIQVLLRQGALTAGHGRCLLACSEDDDRTELAKEAAEGGLSVKALDFKVKIANMAAVDKKKPKDSTKPERRLPRLPEMFADDPALRDMTDQLRTYLQTDVRVDVRADRGGEVVLRFYSDDDLNRLVERILGSSDRHGA